MGKRVYQEVDSLSSYNRSVYCTLLLDAIVNRIEHIYVRDCAVKIARK